eukprot:1950615-Rhodomonas_salina.3
MGFGSALRVSAGFRHGVPLARVPGVECRVLLGGLVELPRSLGLPRPCAYCRPARAWPKVAIFRQILSQFLEFGLKRCLVEQKCNL